MSTSFVSRLKEEWSVAKYTPPDETLYPVGHPEYEPFELSLTYEEQQCRKLIETARFPTEGECFKLVQDWCLRASLHDMQMADACAMKLHAHHALAYESIAHLFYASVTDDFETKARAVGEELDRTGGMPMMWVVYYGFSHAVGKMEAEAMPSSRCGASLHPLVSLAWSGVGSWAH